jgi:hypothetical protein
MRLSLTTLLVAIGAGTGPLALAQTCTPTAIPPHVKIDGKWTRTAPFTLETGQSAILGPQPTSGGST